MQALGDNSIPLEGLAMRTLVTLFIFVFILPVQAEVVYLKEFFGHIHKSQSRYSSSVSTISCGHPLKVVPNDKSIESWIAVESGGINGFIRESKVQKTRPICFQDDYPKFFNQFDFDVSEYYFWGRLYDQYIQTKTKAK
jgi:hypothetical protein